MSGCLSLSSYKMDVENNTMSEEQHCPNPLEKKGIVTILNSDFANFTTPKISTPLNINTIRRTLSADMSSEIRDQSDGFPLKRVQSSEQLKVLGAHENNEEEIVNDNKGSGLGGRAFEDIWSSILSQKKSIGAGSSDPAPYVPQRASSLSEKSLEICTESLGSETGWDGFSNPLPDYGDGEKLEDVGDTKECVEVIKCDNTHIKEADRDTMVKSLVNNNKKINNVGAPRTFPPPLPSLIDRDDGSNLHMRTRREDGRLVLEAVAVIPSRNRFCALREDGRLLLTLTNDDDQKEQDEQEVVNDDDLDFEADEPSTLPYMTKDVVVARSRPFSAMTMSKLMELASSRNKSIWPRTSNMTVIRRSLDEYEDSEKKDSINKVEPTRVKSVSQSLPPRPKVSTASPAASMLNAYEYYWRQTSTPIAAGVAVLKPLAGKRNQYADTASPQVVKEDNKRVNKFLLLGNNNGKVGAQEELVLVGGEKGEYHVPYLRGSNEAKRSHFFWDPYCIPTS